MRGFTFGLGLGLLASAAAVPAAACTSEGEAACETSQGTYYVRLPDGVESPPAVMFLHGFGANAMAMIKSPRVTEALLARGIAVIAPNGRGRDGADGGGWSFMPGRPARRDEGAFLNDVRDDAVDRFGIDPDRVYLGGYSIGGSMASYVACADPDAFAAYVPVAGSFWRPHPESCAGPVRLLHTHGWTDGTVPLEGRPLRSGQIFQGDVFHAMSIWREANSCDGLRATAFDTAGPFWKRAWTECSEGSALELALHPGGHLVPDGWADMAADWLNALPRN